MNPSHPRIIAFDFDGVLASYNGFIAEDDVQEPNAEVVKAMHMLKAKGYEILLHSTRGDVFLKTYCEKFSIPADHINRQPHREGKNPGKPIAFVYVDDRALCYKGEDAESLVSEIVNFKTYWQK
ncbi:MAG TPA: hypothetical protein VNF51_01525 [Candidatus Paceibacterota bacterium]|nr:hypothetical protein [Candidatus Paceibacterota bacterium]